MSAALYRVTFHEMRTLPGCKPALHFEPAKMTPGWRIELTATEVFIISPPDSPSIGEDTAAAMERTANGIDQRRACIVSAIPRGLCALHYVADADVDLDDLGRREDAGWRAPSGALVESRRPKDAEQSAEATPAEVQAAIDESRFRNSLPVPPAAEHACAPRLPTRRTVPLGGKAPVQPPPSVIVEDAGEVAS